MGIVLFGPGTALEAGTVLSICKQANAVFVIKA